MIIPKLKVKRGETIGNEISISFPDLDTNFTFLSADYASGVSSFSVENGLKFSTSQYILANNPGNEKCEIILTHTSTSPTATTITLNSTSSYAHNRGEIIRYIPFNQVVIETSSDNTTYSVLTTIDINPSSSETYYNDSTGAIGTYYRIRFKNSTDTTYSTYSDGVLATGFVANSAGYIIDQALIDLGEEVDGTVLNKKFLYNALNEARREIDEDEGIIRWSFRSVFNYNAYSIIPGQYSIPCPTDLREPDTNKNIISIRIGQDKFPCHYYDQEAFDNDYTGVYHTTLNGALLTGDTSIILTDSGDFEESGDIDIAAQAIDETIDNVDYTGNTETTNTLTGVTGIRAAGHATGTDVWQGASFGLPTNYTVDDSYIYFSQPFNDDYAGENVYIDYYKNITDINSDADLLDEPFYNIYIPYLRYRIKLKKDKNLDWKNDIDFIMWSSLKKAQINKEYFGQKIKINIDIP